MPQIVFTVDIALDIIPFELVLPTSCAAHSVPLVSHTCTAKILPLRLFLVALFLVSRCTQTTRHCCKRARERGGSKSTHSTQQSRGARVHTTAPGMTPTGQSGALWLRLWGVRRAGGGVRPGSDPSRSDQQCSRTAAQSSRPEMNNRIVKACIAAGCSVAGPVLAFSASGFGVKALDSSDGVSSSTRR